MKKLWRRLREEDELDNELRFHIDERIADLIRSGMTDSEARRKVRLEFGGLDQVKDRCRDGRMMHWFDMLAQDLKIAARALRRSPGFVTTAVICLALGIGANTAIFSLVNFVLLKPLPYPDADRIVQLWFTTPGGAGLTFSIPQVNAVTAEGDLFEDVAAYDFGGPGVSITGAGDPELVSAIHVSSAYFRILGARLARGRTFTHEEDRPNSGRTVVLSDGLWQRRFQRDPAIVGKPISLGGEPFTVIGVLAPGFDGEPPAQLFLPLQLDLNNISNATYVRIIGKLRRDVSAEQANARLKLTFASFLRQFPLFNHKAGFVVKPLRETSSGDVRTALLILLFAVAFVLLIACSNVANLLLARAATRKHEMAVRMALGGSRLRLLSQLLMECGLLAVAGGLIGFVFGRACLTWLLAMNPEAIPGSQRFSEVVLDWRMVAFTAAISLSATLLSGLLPALRASSVNLAATMQAAGGRAGTSRGLSRTSSALVVVEVALAVALVAGAGLMIRSFAVLRHVETGLKVDRILTMQMSLKGTRFQDTVSVTGLVNRGIDQIRSVPGVIDAATTWTLPVELAFGSTFTIQGRSLAPGEQVHGPALMRPVSSSYASVFGVPLKAGRFFTDRDTGTSASVAVVSEALAKKYWPDRNPIGERIVLDRHLGPDFAAPPREIVGVVGDVRDLALNREPEPMIYVSQSQVPNGMTKIDARIIPITWAVRTIGDPHQFAPAVQRELKSVSEGLAVGRIRSMNDVVKLSTVRSDLNTILLTAFAAVALLLAAVGIYGLISFSVRQRSRELGIRAALGATPGRILRMVVSQCLGLAVVGIALGTAASFMLARYMETLIYGVQPWDPETIVGSCSVLIALALSASYVPAKRAAKLEASDVLRSEQ